MFELEAGYFEVYKLTDEQKNVVNESKEQIKKGDFLTDEEANDDINEWLGK